MIQCDRLASVTDPLNQVTTYAYDHGNLATATRLSQRDVLFGLEHFLSCGLRKDSRGTEMAASDRRAGDLFPIAPQREQQAF
jgi:YD repeat-containing protein